MFRVRVHPPLFGNKLQRILLCFLEFWRHLERVHLGRPGGMFFSQRMPFPKRRRKNSTQVGVVLKVDPKHVERLTFIPIGHWIDRRNTLNAVVCFGQRDLNSYVVIS